MANDPERKSRGLKSALLALPLAALVCACAQEQPSVLTREPNVAPANYKAEILAYLRTYLNDPVGVREAYIGEPELRPIPASLNNAATERYMVCLRFNAKDSSGKYEGSRDRLVAFLSGRLDTLVPARKEQCAQTNWRPFPELERLRR
jgi:hypothetical protein